MATKHFTSRSHAARIAPPRHRHARQLERVQDFLAGLETGLTLPRSATPDSAEAAKIAQRVRQ